MRKHSELHPCGILRLVPGSSCVMCAWPFAAFNSIRNPLPRVPRLALCCAAMAMESPKRRRIWAKRPPLPHEEPQAPAAQPALAAEAAPAAHRRRPQICPGRGPDRPCCFAADGSGRAANAKGTREGHCSFCHQGNMEASLGRAHGRKIVTRLLKQWRLVAPNIFEAAFNQSVLAEIDGATRESLRAQVSEPTWEELLAKRCSIVAGPSAQELREYQDGVEQDRAYAQKKFFPNRTRTVRHANHQWRAPMSEELRGQVRDLAHNDAGLPAANVSSAAAALETWCKRGSWDLCRQCASVQPRHLKETASRDAAKGNIILCKNCAKKELWLVTRVEEC